MQDVFERGIDTTPGGRRRLAPDAAARRRTSLHDLVQRRQTQQAGRYEDVMDAARRSTSHGLPRASHAGGSRLTALGDHSGPAGSNRESVIGDATLASAMSRVSHAGDPRMSVLGGGHGSRHSGGPGNLGRLEEPPEEELTPEQLEARLAALLETCTFTVFAHTQRGMFDRDKLVFTTLLTTQILLKAFGLGRLGSWGQTWGKSGATLLAHPIAGVGSRSSQDHLRSTLSAAERHHRCTRDGASGEQLFEGLAYRQAAGTCLHAPCGSALRPCLFWEGH